MSEPFYRLHISIPFDDLPRLSWTIAHIVDALRDTPTPGISVWIERPPQAADGNGT